MEILRFVVGQLATNCYIVVSKKKNAFIIDPGDDAAVIRKACATRRIRPRFIVNTHGHIDHIKANSALKLPVGVHAADSGMVSDPGQNLMTSFFGTFEGVKPDMDLKEGDRLKLDGLTFEIWHTPGHSPGGICLVGHGVVFSGDTLFCDGVGRTDFPGASPAKLQESLRRLSGLDDATVVYPGHGPQTTIAREFRPA